MREKSKKPTINDVARVARVSVSTVSRVLNNITPYSSEIGKVVASAVDQIGYKHQRRRSSIFGSVFVLIPDLLNPFFYEILQGMEDEASAVGAMLHVIKVKSGTKAEGRFLKQIMNAACEGVIVCANSCLSDEELQRASENSHIPFVTINRTRVVPGVYSIKIDFADAMYKATKYLLNLNHVRIAFLCGSAESESGRKKREGILAALKERGAVIESKYWLSGLPTLEWGFYAMNSLLDLPATERPTAILAYNDMMALGAMHAVRSRKLHVPNDISVVGFDDITMAAHANPPLTTVAQPKYDLGKLAFKFIADLRNGIEPHMSNFTVLDSPLVVRDSTQVCLRD